MSMAPFTSETSAYFGWISRSHQIWTDSSEPVMVDKEFHPVKTMRRCPRRTLQFHSFARQRYPLGLFEIQFLASASPNGSAWAMWWSTRLAGAEIRSKLIALYIRALKRGCLVLNPWINSSNTIVTRQGSVGWGGKDQSAGCSWFCMNLMNVDAAKDAFGWTDRCMYHMIDVW